VAFIVDKTQVDCVIFDFNNTIVLLDNGRATLFPNIASNIKRLVSLGVALHIISNHKSRDEVINCLVRFNILKYFDQIICSDARFAPKPNLEMFRELQNSVPDLPEIERILYIGDSPVDELFARNIGCRFVFIDEMSSLFANENQSDQ
jgi:phosphoglycolate phosphatase-like HAD superfamily hydrolase